MTTTMRLIAKTTLVANSTTINFTSIPSTYTDLLVIASVRTDRAALTDGLSIRFNSDSSAIYSVRAIQGSGTAATSFSGTAATALLNTVVNSATSTANTFASANIYIPNYASTISKSISIDVCQEGNQTEAYIRLLAGLYANTSAITAMSFFSANGSNIVSGSSFLLYGINKS